MEDRIQEEYTRSSAESGGDLSAVYEIACMERALGHRRGHIRGVGRVVSTSSRGSIRTLVLDVRWGQLLRCDSHIDEHVGASQTMSHIGLEDFDIDVVSKHTTSVLGRCPDASVLVSGNTTLVWMLAHTTHEPYYTIPVMMIEAMQRDQEAMQGNMKYERR
ncbi:hypothetical protein L1987_02565 [Smallanthus sonchifolius]|uniref:Uncharacterized protein n=1 Tax=Smallanthus sonchifolius TaxID=185202 RepID=A0ACB9K871_9ASTR|nr:hypothetical protein L1987_02565 [Smallanthus sonchifolius]